MSTMTAATLSTVVALAIGLVLIAFFPGAVARVLTHIPGRSDHVLEAEEADALNAALALPDTAVQSPETIENVPEKYRVFVLSRPIETRVQFAFMNDDLVFRIPRTETLKVTQVGVTVFNFLLAIPGLLLFLLGVLGFQLVCLSGIQLQFTLIYDDPRSATIIAVLSAVFILTFLFEIYIVTNICNILVSEFGNQYILALSDRFIICKTLSVLRYTQMCPVSSIQQWTSPIAKGQSGGRERIKAYFGRILLILPTEDDGRWICAGLAARYATRGPG